MTLLPPVPGPKLGRFKPNGKTQKFTINFRRILGSGADAIVLHVDILDKPYALKLVCPSIHSVFCIDV